MSEEAASANFELPFSWMDEEGKFIAPFVKTSEKTLPIIDLLLFDQEKTVIPSGALRSGESIVDAGSGDGRVPLHIASRILAQHQKQQTLEEKEEKEEEEQKQQQNLLSNIKIRGFDLDEELVEIANASKKRLLLPSSSAKEEVVDLDFAVADLRDKVEELINTEVVFFYLLPCEELDEILVKITQHWRKSPYSSSSTATSAASGGNRGEGKLRVILSNTWGSPVLKEFEVATIGDIIVHAPPCSSLCKKEKGENEKELVGKEG